jgi:peroxiredoxin
MRLIILSLLFLCTRVSGQDIVKLSGTITDHQSDTVKITYNDNRLAWYPKEYYAHVDDDGHFSISFSVPAKGYVQAELRHGRRLADLLLQAGDSLVLTADAEHFDSTVHYEGRGSEVNNFVARHTLERGRMNQYTLRMRGAMNGETDIFISNIEREKKAEMDLLNKYKASLPKPFVKYWTAYHDYYTYFFMEQYPQMQEIAKKKRYTDTIPLENYAIVKKIPVAFDDEFLNLPPYLLYLTGILDVRLRASGMNYPASDTSGVRRLHDTTQVLVYKQMPSGSAEYFIAQDLYGKVRRQPLARTEKILTRFKKKWPESEYLPLLQKQVDVTERLAPGQPAPDFDINTIDGRHMKLSDLKGKVVYLGFWSVSCRQCVGEMINEKKVQEAIRNKPLEFVYVQIDEDTTMRNSLIKKYSFPGLFTQAKGGWNSKEIQQYGVTGIPAYFLIDTEGKIAVQNAPSPMQRIELIVAIEKLFR